MIVLRDRLLVVAMCRAVLYQAFAALSSCEELALEPLLRSIQTVIADFPLRSGLPHRMSSLLLGADPVILSCCRR